VVVRFKSVQAKLDAKPLIENYSSKKVKSLRCTEIPDRGESGKSKKQRFQESVERRKQKKEKWEKREAKRERQSGADGPNHSDKIGITSSQGSVRGDIARVSKTTFSE